MGRHIRPSASPFAPSVEPEVFSSEDIDAWAEAQVASAPTPSPETLMRVAALLHATSQSTKT
jgi:hypothetical protein